MEGHWIDARTLTIGLSALGMTVAVVVLIVRLSVGYINAALNRHMSDEGELFKGLRESISSLAARVDRLESDRVHVPTRADFAELAIAVKGLEGELKAHSKDLAGARELIREVKVMTDRQEQWLLDNGRPKR